METFQISVVEDGVAIRIPSEKLDSLLQALDAAEVRPYFLERDSVRCEGCPPHR